MAQVISNLDRSYWSEESCSCLKPFVETFGNEPAVKIQLVGPMAVARTMSSTYEQVWAIWFQFVQGLVSQIDGLGLSGDLWIQLDEPYWSGELGLDPQYAGLVCSLRGMRKGNRIGINSSHGDRPEVDSTLAGFCDFLSFNFLERPADQKDEDLWAHLYKVSQTHLIAGVLSPGDAVLKTDLSRFRFLGDRLWMAAPGGHSEWSQAALEARYGSAAFLPVPNDVARVSDVDGKEG